MVSTIVNVVGAYGDLDAEIVRKSCEALSGVLEIGV
jgi:hypothetical protein